MFVSTILASASAAAPPPAPPRPLLPGVTRQATNVFLVEDHSVAAIVWHALSVTNATLLHLDAHDDCRFIPPEKQAALQALFARRDFDEAFRLSNIRGSFRFQVPPDKALFQLGDFIYPCLRDGTVSSFIWVIPEKTMDKNKKASLQAHLAGVLKLNPLPDLVETPGSFTFSLDKARITVTTLESIPTVPPGPILVDIDTDFFALAQTLGETHVAGTLIRDPADVCRFLADRFPAPAAVTVASSVEGGYLPVMFRFLSDAIFDVFSTGRYPDDAVRLLRTVLDLRSNPRPITLPESNPADSSFAPAVEHLRALNSLMKGDETNAMAGVEKAAALNPIYAKGILDLAEAFLTMGKPARAHEMIHRFERFAGGETTHSLAMRVRVYLAENNIQKADSATRKLLDWDPDESHFLMLHGGVRVQQNRLQEAEAVYRKVIAVNPRNPLAYYNMGYVLALQNLGDQAAEYYEKALQVEPAFADAHESLGMLLAGQGQLDKAVFHLQSALAGKPFSTAAWNNLGLTLARQSRLDEAIACYRAALRLDPAMAEAHANLADALLKTKYPAEAAVHCRKALELRPGWEEVADLLRKAQAAKKEEKDRK